MRKVTQIWMLFKEYFLCCLNFEKCQRTDSTAAPQRGSTEALWGSGKTENESLDMHMSHKHTHTDSRIHRKEIERPTSSSVSWKYA